MADNTDKTLTDVGKWRKRVQRFAGKWVPRGAIVAMVAIAIYDKISPGHVPENIELTVFGLMVYFGLEQSESSNAELAQQVGALLSSSSQPTLRSMEQCLNDLRGRLHAMPHGEKITVRHLGLDMYHAWDRVESLLTDHRLQADVDYQMLMISHDPGKIGAVDEGIVELCRQVEKMQKTMCQDVAVIGAQYERAHRKLRVSCKEYVYPPMVHGFEVRGRETICYMAICRWTDNGQYKFDWANDEYYCISVPSNDPVESDLYNVFRSFFDRHWHVGGAEVFCLGTVVPP